MSSMRTVLCALAVLLASSIARGDARQLGTRPTDAWIATLENPSRVAGLKIDEVVLRLRLRPGSSVADIGAGAGAFEGALSAAVTPAGTVYAVDIEQGLLDHIAARAKTLGLSNVRVVLGKYTDPALPTRNVDTALIYDVLHHIKDRETYLRNLAGYLAPGGRIAVVDFIAGKGGHVNDSEQQITRQQTDAWMAGAGLKPVDEIALFDEKWFAIYAK
ncbi:MAG: methyltransferase domain-containing protein [Vicinamibacterales bacterium]